MAAKKSEEDNLDWQSDKSLAECNSRMLTDQIMCDVTFCVGKDSKVFKAHKYILGSRSSVFFAMLFGTMAETKSKIQIPDIEPDIFEILLKFLYTDQIDVDASNVTGLMYAANKYGVTRVLRLCRSYLEESLKTDNVCVIMENARIFDDKELSQKCLTFFLEHPVACLQSDAFSDLSPECVKLIIESDVLAVSEDQIYMAMIRWAENNCQLKEMEQTDANKRRVLGEMINLIRFPLMNRTFFADSVASGNILTEDEKITIFRLMVGTRGSVHETKFSIVPRSPTKQVCFRFQRRCEIPNPDPSDGSTFAMASQWDYQSKKSDKIGFKVSKPVTVLGFILYGCRVQRTEYYINASLQQSGHILAELITKVQTDPSMETFKILFPEPVPILANQLYGASVKIHGLKSYWGEDGQKIINCDDIQFVFSTFM
ncbi:hypothetical protein KUTeg_008105 [Tegillarca granosa]|uniref:BTB domain-containing protein n=1 Tax=Tegillarca granosa TaxID=220873 RepID=A0ABQ9F878_TEGGR|nr:hypothetical protein KUTeg_008105 [Tegillarca granosa]